MKRVPALELDDGTVIAESVETPEQLGDLCAMGVDAAQGYLFDRPMPLAAFVAALQERHGVAAAPQARQ